MTTIEQRFATERDALAAACDRVAKYVLATQYPDRMAVSRHLAAAGAALNRDRPWEEQASAAASLRSLFHKDGFAEWPEPPNCQTWDADLRMLWDLSTIFVEARYREVAAKRATPEATSQQGANGA